MKKPYVLLTILDGFGINKKDIYEEGDAIALAKPAFFNTLKKQYPYSELEASGPAVGIPKGQIGSSEVGHLNIGAGRIVKQELLKINEDIEKGVFEKKKEIKAIMKYCKEHNKPLHLMGLLSRGGVHSSLNHLIALLKIAEKNKVKVYLHAILDGRDTNPKSAKNFLKKINEFFIDNEDWKIVDLIGRFYAMDRDNRLERTKKAYDLYVKGVGKKEKNWKEALNKQYSLNITDEFIEPVVLDGEGNIKEGDALLFFNFRADRARQIIKAFRGELTKDFKKINIYLLTMLPYYNEYNGKTIYQKDVLKNTLGEVFAKNNLTQLRIAETEKFAHVTYFFSGERETPFKNEHRKIIPSPKVKTYDLKPEMSAYKITEETIKAIKSKKFNLIVQNFANTDMVGHTGNLKATIKAVKTVDECLTKIYNNININEWIWIITADHGNAEKMVDNGKPYTAHTLNPVPFIIVSNLTKIKPKNGVLGNIAPTIIDLINRKGIKLKKPKEMIESLIT